jgi:hypothetical protein
MRTLIAGVACCLSFICPAATAQEESPIRYRTEANFLAHFASFVDWPEGAFSDIHAPVHLCLFADVDFGNSLQELTKEVMPKRRHVDVRSVKTIEQARACHILFIGRDDAKKYGAILNLIRDLPVLTVGETPDFLDAGGIVNFVFAETLQIDINLGAADRAHLKIRSPLAALARRVINPRTAGHP